MPNVMLSGQNGKVSQGTTPTALLTIQQWDAEIIQDKQVQGPFLNDAGLLYYARTSRSCKWSFKGVVPSGKDASETAIITALTSGADIALIMSNGTGGYTVTVGTALVDSIKLGHDAKGTATFEAAGLDQGGFTVT